MGAGLAAKSDLDWSWRLCLLHCIGGGQKAVCSKTSQAIEEQFRPFLSRLQLLCHEANAEHRSMYHTLASCQNSLSRQQS